MRLSFIPIIVTLLFTFALSATADELSPTDAYVQFHKAMLAATAVDALTPYLCKEVSDEIARTPADMKPAMFGLMKDLTPKTVKVTSEKIDGDRATLTVSGEAGDSASPAEKAATKGEGTVTLVREDGSWKVDKESWKTNTVMTGTPDSPN